MANFGWAYLSGAVTGQGITGSVQYLAGDRVLTGSKEFWFDDPNDTLYLTGTMIISGTLQAHTFDVIHTNKIEISSSGGSNFGNDASDSHIFTGSISVISGGFGCF